MCAVTKHGKQIALRLVKKQHRKTALTTYRNPSTTY